MQHAFFPKLPLGLLESVSSPSFFSPLSISWLFGGAIWAEDIANGEFRRKNLNKLIYTCIFFSNNKINQFFMISGAFKILQIYGELCSPGCYTKFFILRVTRFKNEFQ
jgi:hypothetical protein